MEHWANLPTDILYEITQHLSFLDDFIVSAAVCKSWNLAIAPLKKLLLPPRMPWLMLAEEGDQGNKKEAIPERGFFNLSNQKTYKFKLPEAAGKRCYGTSFGWLLTIGVDLQINLLHPFCRCEISLPPQPTFNMLYDIYDGYDYDDEVERQCLRNFFIQKVVLSTNPWTSEGRDYKYNPECIVMVIYGEFQILAFARLGDKKWTDVQVPSRVYTDIIYYKKKLYAVNCFSETFVCDIDDGQTPKATIIAPAPEGTKDSDMKYLVESPEGLLLVTRIYRGSFYEKYPKELQPIYITEGFTVMRLVNHENQGSEYKYRWEEIDSLGDQALFVGSNSSISLPASTFSGCKANCIYFTDDNEFAFTDDNHLAGYDMGIFSMEDKTIKPHYKGESLSRFCSPLWYV